MKITDVIDSFSAMYWNALEKFREHELNAFDSVLEKRFMDEFQKPLSWILRHCGTLIPPSASLEALEIATKHKIDLFALQWKDQPIAEKRINGQEGRIIFHHEHEIPIVLMQKDLLNANSLKSVNEVFCKQSIVWITKDENRKLPQTKRDQNSYKNAGIVYETNPHNDMWMERPFITN
jgi:hypothetical protein